MLSASVACPIKSSCASDHWRGRGSGSRVRGQVCPDGLKVSLSFVNVDVNVESEVKPEKKSQSSWSSSTETIKSQNIDDRWVISWFCSLMTAFSNRLNIRKCLCCRICSIFVSTRKLNWDKVETFSITVCGGHMESECCD